jgi:anti-anti-sigma regulatory factor
LEFTDARKSGNRYIGAADGAALSLKEERRLVEIQVATNEQNQIGIFFKGPINEESDHALKLLEQQLRQHTEIFFNFDLVTSVDSLGVRAWVQFLRSIKSPARTIHFILCSSDIISQVNMIPSFSEGATIDSFFVSYVCPACEHTMRVLIETAGVPKGTFPSSPNCPSCKSSEMETEELEDEYFAFLSRI